ncbi:YaiO family outer membrane beta-barrel protein [Pedobacter panaciterrae]
MNHALKISFALNTSIFSFQFLQAQDQNIGSDELFTKARSAAFDQKDYPKAISLSKQALAKSPDYTDIRIFLGRVYTWNKQPDSARQAFSQVLNKQPDNADASLAFASLEFWEGNSEKALEHVNSGLKHHSDASDLLLLKAKVLNDLKRWSEANIEIEKVIKADPNMTEARTLAARVRENSSKNKIGVNYDFIYFDKQFDDPWHLVSVDYSHQTALGSVIGRINYANRFKNNGVQFEIDAYPRISNTFQAYISGGYSNNVGVFPQYRAGFSLYANLPASFEAEAGFRYLTFGESTWIYTASVGKYYKSFWFNFRTFLTPSNNEVSQSFALTSRYYYGGADDYFSLRLGTGLSPDDPQNNVLIGNANYKLRSNNITLGYRRAFKSLNILIVNLGVDNQEYKLNTRGTQIDLGLGYIRRF